MDGTNSTMEKAEKRISEGKTEITQFEQQKENRLGGFGKPLKKKRASGICWTVTKETGMKNHSKKCVKMLQIRQKIETYR